MASSAPFQTKFTIGLLTIEPCPLDDEIHCDVEEVSNDVKAEHALINEQAKAAIAAKKAKKKKSRSQSPGKKPTRTKSRSQSPNSKKKKEETMLLKKKKLEEEAAAKKKLAEEEEAKKKLSEEEEAAAKKAQEEAEAKRLAEEEAEEKALAEFAALAEKEEQARQQAQQQEEEEAIMDASMDTSMASIVPRPTKFRPKRRISMFPACKSNIGLNQALQRYGSDVPFDWEKPEWTKEHVDLRHTSRINNTYGWEKPEWARRSVLKKTTLGSVVKKGVSLDRRLSKNSGTSRMLLRRRHSLTGRSSFDQTTKEFGWSQPEWARRNILRTTEFGEAARQGANLAVPVSLFKAMGGSDDDMCYHHQTTMEESFASLNASSKQRMSIIAWEKPEWAKKQTLKSTSTGHAVRQGADLSLPPVGIKEILMGDESARTRTRTRDGQYEKSPNSSFANLDYSDRNANLQWEKPSWANVSLKRTSKGDKMKNTGTLANPITPRRSKSSDY